MTTHLVEEVPTENGYFKPDSVYNKICVVERHGKTGEIGVAPLKGFGVKGGAVATSVAHDSHNIIVVGTNNEDMAFAVSKLIELEGGIVVVDGGEVLESMPLPIAGLMSDKSGEWVRDKLTQIHNIAYDRLKVNPNVEPTMTLCFMSLPVIPEVKITDIGLFDVVEQKFIK